MSTRDEAAGGDSANAGLNLRAKSGGLGKPAGFEDYLRGIIRARLLSTVVGVLMYLVIDRFHDLQAKWVEAEDAIDLVRILVYVIFCLSLASFGQLVWDLIMLGFKRVMPSRFEPKNTGGVLAGCPALFGYFLARMGSGLWQEFEDHSVCLVRWRGSVYGGPRCVNTMFQLTLDLEKKICELSSPACSRLVFLGPYALVGGMLLVFGLVVALEYMGYHDVQVCFDDDDTLDSDEILYTTLSNVRHRSREKRATVFRRYM